jgi:hypothetical protein
MSIKQMFTTKNVAVWDRLLRALPALGVALAWGAGITGSTLVVLAVMAGMLLVTSVTGTCSIYYMLGWSTCPVSGRSKPVQ